MKTVEKILELNNVCKYFGDLKANDGITFDVEAGEVHAIVGENGAGKTTLMNVIYGLYQPDRGEILFKGRSADFTSPKDALAAGIGMVHQHFMLVPTLTVLQNIIVGREPTKKGVIDIARARREVLEIARDYHLDIDVDAKVRDISVGMKQRVEIVKALYRGADVLILDEPSAVLTPQEIEQLYEIIHIFKQQGKTVIFITHKLEEVKKTADRITVLRQGKYIGTVRNEEVDTLQITTMMVGHDVAESGKNREATDTSKHVLEVRGLRARNKDGKYVLDGVDLAVRGGEVFGLAGVDGNGQSELVEAISGMRRAEEGEILLEGRPVAGLSAQQIRQRGLSYIPEDRHRQGLVLDYPVKYNLILGLHRQPEFDRRGWLDEKNVAKNSRAQIEKYDIRPARWDVPAATLSGGNQQKIVVAREMERDSPLIIAMQPTRGLDVGAIEFVHRTLMDARNKGKGVLLVSFELDEVLALSDRIGVMHNGKIVGILDRAEANRMTLGVMMLSGKTYEEMTNEKETS